MINPNLSKSFSLFHTTDIENIKKLFKGLFFLENFFYIKIFSNEVDFKFSKNVELKIVNDPKIEQHVEWKMEYNCHGAKNVKFKFEN